VRVRAGDVELFVEICGGRGLLDSGVRLPVLVGLHGGPGLDGAKLRHELATLADVAQVVVPDQRGHGRSDRCGPECWNLETWAQDVKNLADGLGVANPIVLGTSFGGFVAQKYAAMFPQHPAGLILISASPRFPTLEQSVECFGELGGEAAANAVRRDWEAPSPETEAEWERVCGPLLSLRDDRRDELDRLMGLRIRTVDVTVHFMAEGKRMDLRTELSAVRCPTLIIVGEHDPLVPVELANEILEALPAGLGSLRVIADAAHEVFIDNPEETYGAIRQFLTA
jgi:pimeloyl-ACP methyl ester carboxylesterase